MIIKDDIIHRKSISLDEWSSFGFKTNFIFGKERDGIHYFLIVRPDGSFEFKKKINNLQPFKDKILDKCSDFLTNNKGKEKIVISDSIGNTIIISRTSMFMLPNKELFTLPAISRGKEAREQYLSGVTDINLYDFNNESFYSVGIRGNGMQTTIPKASHLYQVNVIEGQNFIYDLLATMAVSFVKYKSFTVVPYPIKYLNEYILMETKE